VASRGFVNNEDFSRMQLVILAKRNRICYSPYPVLPSAGILPHLDWPLTMQTIIGLLKKREIEGGCIIVFSHLVIAM